MHKAFSLIVFSLLVFNFGGIKVSFAQKIGYFDSEYVLNKMPEYAEKKKEIEALAETYDKQVRSLYDTLQKMRAELRATEVLLTPAMKSDREKSIQKKQEEALKKNTTFFGYNGLFYKKVDELLLPLRNKVNQAVEVVARMYGLDYVYDKAADVGLVYTNPVHDYTEFILKELGVKTFDKW